MSHEEQARLIAERIARRVTAGSGSRPVETSEPTAAPMSEELSAIRSGLHDLERQLDRIVSRFLESNAPRADQPRARLIDFVSPRPAQVTSGLTQSTSPSAGTEFIPPTHSPWLGSTSGMYSNPALTAEKHPLSAHRDVQVASHPSQERFGVEEATVTELVEFFENEKKCSVDPSGKPCDHCAMCSSRGF